MESLSLYKRIHSTLSSRSKKPLGHLEIEHFQSFAEHLPSVLWFIDVGEKLSFRYVNSALETIWGRNPEELYKDCMAWVNWVHPQNRDAMLSVFEDLVAGRIDTLQEEFRIIRPDDSHRYLSCKGFCLRDEKGKVYAVAGITQDITEYQRTFETLQRSESQFRVITETLKEVLYICSADGTRVLYINPAYENIWGRPRKQLYKDFGSWLEAIHDDDRARVLEAWEHKARVGQFREEYRIIRPDGSSRWILDKAVPVKNAKGELTKIIGIAEDITRYKGMENYLLELSQSLEQQVHERASAAEKRARELEKTNLELDAVTKELRVANAELERLSILDPLTELLNRRGFHRALTREIKLAQREYTTLQAILLDVDDFKTVNDSLGYTVGDVLLQEVAHRLEIAVRSTDYVARLGGDEFMILLPDTSTDEALQIAEKVRLKISQSPIAIASGDTVDLTASIGVVQVPLIAQSLDALLSQAYLSLRQSKRSGKNKVFCGCHMPDPTDNHKTALSETLVAMQDQYQFTVVVQPVMDLQTDETVGYELLSRLKHPTFTMPQDFFKLCLEANILTHVDHQCFKNCLETVAQYFPQDCHAHINLFPSTLINIPVNELLQLFPEHIPLEQCCIEISEQQLIGNPKYLIETVEELKKHGVQIAIDDVGFGRTCLENLVLLEPQIIKIDKQCVQGVAKNAEQLDSLKRFLRVSEAINATTIAEGIEYQPDLNVLKDLGVQYGQGYLLGRPNTPETFGLAAMVH